MIIFPVDLFHVCLTRHFRVVVRVMFVMRRRLVRAIPASHFIFEFSFWIDVATMHQDAELPLLNLSKLKSNLGAQIEFPKGPNFSNSRWS